MYMWPVGLSRFAADPCSGVVSVACAEELIALLGCLYALLTV